MNPFDQALNLLKTSVRGIGRDASDYIYHYPHELDDGLVSSFMESNPNATLGDMVAPYLQGQFTGTAMPNPPSHQSTVQNQFQDTVQAPFPQTDEHIEGVSNLMSSGVEGYSPAIAGRTNPDKEYYDSMNNAVRVLSRNLRANPLYYFSPGQVRSTGQKGAGRNRATQNRKLMSLLDTPVSFQSSPEMTPPPLQGVPIAAGEPMDIAFQLLKEEVIDMVEMPPGSGNFVSRAEALAAMRAQGAPMTDPNASSMERIRQARMLREQGI